jgi:hypothetical protein
MEQGEAGADDGEPMEMKTVAAWVAGGLLTPLNCSK